jgi:protein phosphatase
VTVEQSSRVVADSSGGVEVAGATDRGTVRAENQDAWEVVPRSRDGYALLLADGMGGHPGGRESAEAAIEAASARLSEPGSADSLLTMAMNDANAAVAGVRDSMGGEPGTTLVLALVADEHAVIANIGDSRAYLVRRGRAMQVTDDHSWVGEQVREGKLGGNEARHHPRRNIITRAVMGDPVEPDLFPVVLQSGDTLLLCSDGVWEPLSDEMLAELLTAGGPLIRDLQRLCDAALDAGGRDNVTVVAARVT